MVADSDRSQTSNYIDIGPDIHAFRTQNVTNELDLLQRDTDWYCTQYATAAYRLGDEAVDTLPWENHGPSISITNPFEPAASFAFPSPYSHVAWTPFEGDVSHSQRAARALDSRDTHTVPSPLSPIQPRSPPYSQEVTRTQITT